MHVRIINAGRLSVALLLGMYVCTADLARAELPKVEALLPFKEEPHKIENQTDWARVVRGFRRDHNFACSLALANNRWTGRTQTIDRFEAQTKAFQLQLDYSFHLPLFRGLGYTLGTHAGMIFEEQDARGFALARTYVLPGIELGLVWNLNEYLRLLASAVYGWQRVENMTLDKNPGEGSGKLAATGDTKSYRIALDYFFEMSIALRVESEELDFSYSSKDRFELRKNSRVLRLGLIKHLL